MPFKLTNDQQTTIDKFIDFLADTANEYMIIQGAAGTGKSTLIKLIAETAVKHGQMCALLQKDTAAEDVDILLSATTNPAVAVLENLTGIQARTIHSILGLKIINSFKTGKTKLILTKSAEEIHNKLIIIDEASMINDSLYSYIKSQTVNCKIVLIGDWYQLAPVGQTTVTMQHIPGVQAVMNQIVRNDGIIMAAGQQFRDTVETGVFNPIPIDNKNILQVDGSTFQALVDAEFTKTDYSPKTAKILAYSNNRVLEYTNYIRKVKNYPAELQVGETVITNKPMFGTGSQITVDSTVTITGMGKAYTDETSDIKGRLVEINNKHQAFLPTSTIEANQYMRSMAKKKKWTEYFNVKDTWLDLRLPYASTVHKAQGATYDKVFIDLDNIGRCFIASDVARMLYVAISRARKQVILYGQLPPKYGG